MNRRILTTCLLAGCMASMVFLTGCLLLPVAAVGFGGVKVVQALSKSTYEVHLDTPTVEDTNALASVNSIALWPEAKGQTATGKDMVSNPLLAEQLAKGGKMEIITPMSVTQVLRSNSLPQSLDEMMAKEKLQAFKVVCEQAGADALLCSSSSDMKDDSRFFTFKRASETFTAQVQLYSKAKDDFIWQDNVIVVWKKGSTLPSDAEIQKSVAEALAKQLLIITGKKPAPVAGTNTVATAKTP